MIRKREIRIENQEVGQELLSWISNRYTYHTKDKWKEYILDKRVTLNGEDVQPGIILKKNDLVIYFPEPITEPPINPNYKTIFEDEDLLIIDKPSDLPCHPGGIYFEHTLWYILKQKYNYISLINRLDRETSGVMLIAKNKVSAKFYFNKMMDRKIDKEYLVLVHGNTPDSINGKGWLTPDTDSVIRKKRRFILDDTAKQPGGQGNPNKQFTHTIFKKVESKNGYTLLSCKILTGRTHQIRATISSLGFPVVADKIYGLDDSYFFKFINNQLTNTDKELLVLENQCLHSYKTTVPKIYGENKTFTAKLPKKWPISFNDIFTKICW